MCSTKTSTFCRIIQSHFLIPGPSQRARGAAERPDSVLCSSNPLPPALIHHQAGGGPFQTAHAWCFIYLKVTDVTVICFHELSFICFL